jgi:hypothetical protein
VPVDGAGTLVIGGTQVSFFGTTQK